MFEWNFVWMKFCSNEILSEGTFVRIKFCSNEIYVPTNFCPKDILFQWTFVGRNFCPNKILFKWNFVQMKFCSNEILFEWNLCSNKLLSKGYFVPIHFQDFSTILTLFTALFYNIKDLNESCIIFSPYLGGYNPRPNSCFIIPLNLFLYRYSFG